jgi:tetratricopeptide (TPR) repeat protein
MNKPQKKRIGFDTSRTTRKQGRKKTFRNAEAGFEIDVPEDWSLPTGDSLDDIRCRPDEAVHFAIGPPLPELLPDYIEREFTRYAQGKGYTNLEFGRISVGGKEHVWARYREGHGEWTKKYMLTFGGIQYVITTTGINQTTVAKREKVWDAMVSSFRLSESRQQDIVKQKAHRSEIAGQLYERAYEAVSAGRYSEAHDLLERCLNDNPDHILAHKELAVVLKKMGDLKGALSHRMEVKRLDPSDTVNRFNLADLLAVLGARDVALQEVEELLLIEPNNPTFQALKSVFLIY